MHQDEPTRILKHVYIGSQHDAKRRQVLAKLKITHILNCTPPRSVDPLSGVPSYFDKDKDIVYRRISIFDNAGEDILGKMDSAVDFIDCAKHYGAVLVHCKKVYSCGRCLLKLYDHHNLMQGVSRSASFVIGYLMKMNEFSLAEALEYVQARRPEVNPNPAFMDQLREYDYQLQTLRGESAALSASTMTSGPSGPPEMCIAGRSESSSSNIEVEAGPMKPALAHDSPVGERADLYPRGCTDQQNLLSVDRSPQNNVALASVKSDISNDGVVCTVVKKRRIA